jgi:hypothetical protein
MSSEFVVMIHHYHKTSDLMSPVVGEGLLYIDESL